MARVFVKIGAASDRFPGSFWRGASVSRFVRSTPYHFLGLLKGCGVCSVFSVVAYSVPAGIRRKNFSNLWFMLFLVRLLLIFGMGLREMAD